MKRIGEPARLPILRALANRMTLRSEQQTERPSPARVMLARGSMEHAYRELLGSHVIITVVTATVLMVCTFGLIGPIGFITVASPVVRIARALLYAALCFPAYYGGLVLLYYFLRFRSPLELLAGVTLTLPLASFQISAVIYTIETLGRTGQPPAMSFVDVFLKIIGASMVGIYLCFYVVWQRTRHTTGARGRAAAGRSFPAAGSGASEAAAAQAQAGAGDRPAAVEARDEPAEARAVSEGGRPQPAAAGSAAAGDNLLKLLPSRLGTDLVYVKSEDHYLEVHTTVGSSLIKMRFSDAVAELGDRGMQVHRSYWVATGHVVRTARNGKRTMLRLTGDREVPVSVTHLRAVRDLLDR